MQVDRVPWHDFLAGFRWEQGDHVALVGPTKSGKTTLARAILPARSHVAVLATKPQDDTLTRWFRDDGFTVVRDWRPSKVTPLRKVALWPRYTGPSSAPAQAVVLRQALESIFQAGRWCVYLDELRVLARRYRLGQFVEDLYTQGRSSKITTVGATQRPRHVPREAWTEASHVFVAGFHDLDDLRAMGGFGIFDAREVRGVVTNLSLHEFAHFDMAKRQILVTKVER